MFEEHVPLARYSYYKIGGPARYFYRPSTIEQLTEGVETAGRMGLPIFVLAGATNLLIHDQGFAGLVLKPELLGITRVGYALEVGAGVPMHDVLEFAAEHGLAGLEWAGGLPGTLGGAIRGNAGAFRGEIKDAVATVTSVATNEPYVNLRTRTASECEFGYRTSVFKGAARKEIIIGATLVLRPGDPALIREQMKEKITYRALRHPLEYPNIGSIFKNVDWRAVPLEHQELLRPHLKTDPFPVVPVAYLISQTGLRGVANGGVMISPKHPNFIVNVLNGRAAEVRGLIQLVKESVGEKFGIQLEEEVVSV